MVSGAKVAEASIEDRPCGFDANYPKGDLWKVQKFNLQKPLSTNGAYGTRIVRFETGRLAKQATGSAFVMLDEESSMLSTTTVGKSPREGFDFFPLTVDVEERQYAAGKIRLVLPP